MKLLTYVFIIWYFLQYFLTKDMHILPDGFVLVDDIILYFMFAAVFVSKKLFENKEIKTNLAPYVFLFIFIGVFSASVNKTLLTVNTLAGLRFFIQPIMIFYVLLNSGLSEKDYKGIVKLIFAMMIIQLPIVVYQFLFHNPGSKTAWVDSMYGTFGAGSANLLGYYAILFISLSVAFYNKKTISKMQFVLLMIAFVIPFVFSFSRAGYVLIIFVLLINIGFGIKDNSYFATKLFKIMGKGALALVVIYISALGLMKYGGNELFIENLNIFSGMESTEGLVYEQTNQGSSARLFMAFSVLTELSNDPISITFGWGPGNFSSFAGLTLFANKVIPWKMLMGGTEAKFDIEALALVSEYGILGLIAYYMIFIRFFIKLARVNSQKDNYWSAIEKGFMAWAIVYIFVPLVYPVFQTQWISYTFWMFAGMLYKMNIDNRRNVSIVNTYK